MKREQLLEKLDKVHNEIIEIVINRNNDYIDDIDMLDSDINSDYENGIIEDMNNKKLEEYVEDIIKRYKECVSVYMNGDK